MTYRALEQYLAALGLGAASVTPEDQSGDYESGRVHLPDGEWHIRTARITPKKPGAFVAFWHRAMSGTTRPFRGDEVGAGLLVFVTDGDHRGAFRFTAAHLAELGVTAGRTAGKRGFRVYPEWCAELNRQAERTQRAQAPAFHPY
ncbi:metallopeptidase [Microbacterium sorbitolivorans]|uniref:Metallopeptidase n=1 Tax=Microbacterium sorbitolivorans TaxID=1867410 RepID=A0A367Y2H8_9MICO|nr:MepB family protein [Microbacterium sorbitolivorans]RCK60038.1 metallopeptidase [Microbacterium sorbitolivorans]GGF42197.1 metallopeptidase [Microbacterium sorbitolivorans]